MSESKEVITVPKKGLEEILERLKQMERRLSGN